MLSLDGVAVAHVPPGPSIHEVDCVRDLVDGLREEGFGDDEIRVLARAMRSDSFLRFWERTWAGPGQRRYFDTETTAAVLARIVDAILTPENR